MIADDAAASVTRASADRVSGVQQHFVDNFATAMLRLPRFGLYLLLMISLLFVAAGLAMVAAGAENGWLVLIFFGVCGLVAIGELRPALLRDRTLDPRALLDAFPGPVTLHASRRRALFLLVTGAGFAASFGWLLWSQEPSLAASIALWPGLVLFGLALPVGIAMLLRRPFIRLDEEALTLTHLGRRSVMHWTNLGGFKVAGIPPSGMRLVVFDHRPNGQGQGRSLSHAITGRNASLPDSYGLSPEDLAALLEGWRERALAARTGPGQGT